MVGLFDILPANETVSIRGNKHVAYGLSPTDIGVLAGRFPELQKLMAADGFGAHELIKLGDDAVNTIIVMGMQPPKSEERRLIAESLGLLSEKPSAFDGSVENLNLGEKAKCLSAIVKATIGDEGFGPFAELVQVMGLEEVFKEIRLAFRNVIGQLQTLKVTAPVNGSQPASTTSLVADIPPNSSLQ